MKNQEALMRQFSEAMTTLASLHDAVRSLAPTPVARSLHKAVDHAILGLGDAACQLEVSEQTVRTERALRDQIHDAVDDALRGISIASKAKRSPQKSTAA